MDKKGATGGSAAVVIIIITALVVLYVLFLPPDVRDELLNDGSSSSGGSGGVDGKPGQSTLLLNEHVGKLNYLRFSDRTHDIPSFTIYSLTEAKPIKTASSVYTQNSWLEKKIANITFSMNPDLAQNVLLVYNVQDHDGRLQMSLNGHELIDAEVSGTPPPIAIPQEWLQTQNELLITVNSPGWAFWRVHEYLLSDMQFIADVTDRSNSRSEQHFSLAETELENFDRALLWFYPDCDQSKVGALSIHLNGNAVFNSIADCGVLNHIELDSASLLEGDNLLQFSTFSGRYLIDQTKVKLYLKNATFPVYYFDMDEDYFTSTASNGICGEYDGYCPVGCTTDRDADCCYNDDSYWCPVATRYAADRCVPYVYADECSRCAAGYQNENGRPTDSCEDTCGDDTDNYCPSGCSIFYDKDCCFDDNDDNYWCKEVPLTGLENTCTPSVTSSSCRDCPSGYRKDGGSAPSCNRPDTELTEDLDSSYSVNLTVTFVNNADKKLDVNVNGRRIAIDTNKISYTRLIDDYVRPGTNSVELIPRSDVEVASVSVRVRNV